MNEFTIEPGSMRDYHALAHLHYRAASPATATRVYRVVDPRPTVVGRYLGRRDETQTLGVLVVSLPHLGCAARNLALGERYRGLARREAARLLNAELRTISRVVIDPRCRGLGLAVALVRRALDEARTPWTEALAAMGRANPFFEKAGMTRYDPPDDPAVERLVSAFETMGVNPAMLAWPSRLIEQLDARCARCDVSTSQREWFEREIRRVARRGRGRMKHHTISLRDALVAARHRMWSRPVYYLAMRDEGTVDSPSRQPRDRAVAGRFSMSTV